MNNKQLVITGHVWALMAFLVFLIIGLAFATK
jgi:hypothetical protein